jgi:cytoskeletal protein CcmA (bactofilin family)
MANSTDAAFAAREEPVASNTAPSRLPSAPRDGTGALMLEPSKARATDHLLIDVSSVLTGNLTFDGDIVLRGKFIGNIRCRSLIVDTSAVLQAAVTAREVTIRGAASGSIEAECVRIERTAVIDSEISQKQFKRKEGAQTGETLVEAAKEVTTRPDTIKGPAASESLMARLAEVRHHRQRDLSHCPPLDK